MLRGAQVSITVTLCFGARVLGALARNQKNQHRKNEKIEKSEKQKLRNRKTEMQSLRIKNEQIATLRRRMFQAWKCGILRNSGSICLAPRLIVVPSRFARAAARPIADNA